jgi:NAD+ kinase
MSNPIKDENYLYAKDVISFLNKRAQLYLYEDILSLSSDESAEKLTADTADLCDAILILGGDGTILEGIKTLNFTKTPLMGINLGKLGFLATVEKYEWQYYLDMILQDLYAIEERVLVEMTHSEGSYVALNEFIFFRDNEQDGAINMHVYIDHTFLAEYDADGLIVATPTGSTAYSLSSGGPIINPKIEALLLNPIRPHSLYNRPIIIDPNEKIRIVVRRGKCIVRCDGKRCLDIKDMSMEFFVSEKKIKFIIFDNHNFYKDFYSKIR